MKTHTSLLGDGAKNVLIHQSHQVTPSTATQDTYDQYNNITGTATPSGTSQSANS